MVIYCFPYSLPVTAQNMNHTCLITGGLTIFVGILWFWKSKRRYGEPQGLVERRLSEACVGRLSGIKISLSKRRCSGIQM